MFKGSTFYNVLLKKFRKNKQGVDASFHTYSQTLEYNQIKRKKTFSTGISKSWVHRGSNLHFMIKNEVEQVFMCLSFTVFF